MTTDDDPGDANAPTSESPKGYDTEFDLIGIVAVADNDVIGLDGEMPWHVPEDLRHFKETTMGHPVITGRVTYEGILAGLGEPLPGRTSVVLTSRTFATTERVLLANDPVEAVRIADLAARERHDCEAIFVAGGETVYETFLPALDRLIVTEIHDEPEGDTHLPWERGNWMEVDRERRDGHAFVEYVPRDDSDN